MRPLYALVLLFIIINKRTQGLGDGDALIPGYTRLDHDMECNLEQKGFHMKLRCSLTPTTRGAWDQCTINIDLARGVYVNPYELAEKAPNVKFTISRKSTRKASWFSRTFLSSEVTTESDSEQEVFLNVSEVDIEAPSWRAEPLRWRFTLNTSRQTTGADAAVELDIPLHLRYQLPSKSGSSSYGGASRTGFACGDGDDGHGSTQNAEASHGCSSDLLLVLPLTLVFLVIGIVAMLFH